MGWQQLVVFLVPLITAWIALRSTGSRRWVAVIATVAAAGAFTPAVSEAARIVHPAAGLILPAIGFVAILTLAAGSLRHWSQWLAVGLGALSVGSFFVAFALNLQFLPPEALGALLSAGVAVMLGVPGIIDAVLKARERRSQGGGESWHPSQWAAAGVGALTIAAAVALYAIPGTRWLVNRDVLLAVCFVGLLVSVLVPRFIGQVVKTKP